MLAKLHFKHGGIQYAQVPDEFERSVRVMFKRDTLETNFGSIFDAFDKNNHKFEVMGTQELFGQKTLILEEI